MPRPAASIIISCCSFFSSRRWAWRFAPRSSADPIRGDGWRSARWLAADCGCRLNSCRLRRRWAFEAKISEGYAGPIIVSEGDSWFQFPILLDDTIDNLSRDVRNAILTDTSPFTKNRKRRKMILEAGRARDGVFRLFEGEVLSSSISQPPDITLSIEAQTGAFHAGVIVAREGSAIDKLSVIAGRIAQDLGAVLVFEAEDKQVANYSFSGAALRQVDALNRMGVNAYVDDDKLVVKNRGEPLANRSRILNKESGLVGLPETTERGVKLTCMLDRHLTLGGVVEIDSDLNPSLNGAYTIFKLDFEVATHDTPFYHIVEAERRA